MLVGLVEELGNDLIAMGWQGFGFFGDGFIVQPWRHVIEIVLFGVGSFLFIFGESTRHKFYDEIIIKAQLFVRMKRFRRQLALEKENVKLHPELMSKPIDSRLNKFGKSIRDRALQPRQPNQQLQDSQRRQSAKPRREKGVHIPPLPKFNASMSVNEEENEPTDRRVTKSVRFSNKQQPETPPLKSNRKSASILKNSNSFDKTSLNSLNSHVGSISGGLSAKASLRDKGVSCENTKYEDILKRLKAENKKYFDELFPPGSASLFYTKALMAEHKETKWMRADEVFPGQKILLWSHEDRNLVLRGQFEKLGYMATAFNAIGSSARCIERIFEGQTYNRHGLYYLRLNHEGIWKYMVIDDYIPVQRTKKEIIPLFLGVRPPKSKYVELWPFLLQKALAKFYACYEALMSDNAYNFIQELTGIVPETLSAHNPLLLPKLQTSFLGPDNIVVGKSSSLSEEYYPLVESSCFAEEEALKILPSSAQERPTDLAFCEAKKHFNCFAIYTLDDTYFSVGCIIKQQRGGISLRKLKVEALTTCSLSLIQKDRKHYRNNGYEYVWMRLMVVMKDVDGYRWIHGAYDKAKILNCGCVLSAGEYYLLVMGDWGKRVHDVTLNYQGNSDVQLERESIAKHPRIMQEIGVDLAQRFGVCKQINKDLCSYQYVDTQNGFIIENLNNECSRGVWLRKSYHLLPTLANIGVPFTGRGSLEVEIEAGGSSTVMLKFTEGIDYGFLRDFHFQ